MHTRAWFHLSQTPDLIQYFGASFADMISDNLLFQAVPSISLADLFSYHQVTPWVTHWLPAKFYILIGQADEIDLSSSRNYQES